MLDYALLDWHESSVCVCVCVNAVYTTVMEHSLEEGRAVFQSKETAEFGMVGGKRARLDPL